jgi:hypothetical protein
MMTLMRLRPVATLVLTLLLARTALAGEPPADFVKKEAAALKKVGDEIVKLARIARNGKVYSGAREELEKGIAVCPENRKLSLELKRLPDREDAPKNGFLAGWRKERDAAYRKCAGHLAKVALLYDQKGFVEEFDRLVEVVLLRFPVEGALEPFGLVWFEPYRKWARKDAAERLAKGWERIDGAWVEPAKVTALDKEHASWASPWVLSDEVHELKTTLPYRKARQIMDHVTAFRRFFLAEFAGQWDLVAPTGKLPIIVTDSQSDLRTQLQKASGGRAPQSLQGAAYYMWTNTALNPCFATLEPSVTNGGTIRIGLPGLFRSLQHEITHQLAAEYSKHDCDRTRMIEHQFWCVEGIANFMVYYVRERDGWRLTHPKTLKVGSGLLRGAFAYVKGRLSSLPTLEAFFSIPRARFLTIENYMIAATVSYFMLEGADDRYRKPFIKLMETVHKVHDSPTCFDECFEGVDRAKMQKDWEAFVKAIVLDP